MWSIIIILIVLQLSANLYPQKVEIKSYSSKMVKVEGGIFTMGATGTQLLKAENDELPAHDVRVGSFMISKTELTLGEFKEFIISTGYKTSADEFNLSAVWYGGDSHSLVAGVNWGCDTKGEKRLLTELDQPVIHVSWYDAIEYCNWLSKKEGLTQCYLISKEQKDQNNGSEYDKQKWRVTCNFKANGYRLPTEAEWEFAARGGNKSKGYEYSGSNNLDEVGWYGAYNNVGNSTINGGTSEVGKKQPNELGLYDMSGNVVEWCWDWAEVYTSPTQTNPTGPSKGSLRRMRGGGWVGHRGFCRVADRNAANPDYRDHMCGFRIVRTI